VDLSKAAPSDLSRPFDPDRHLMVVPVRGTYEGMLKLYCESALMTAPYDNYVAVYLDQKNKQYPVRWVDFRYDLKKQPHERIVPNATIVFLDTTGFLWEKFW
jgi:hypothetical protein